MPTRLLLDQPREETADLLDLIGTVLPPTQAPSVAPTSPGVVRPPRNIRDLILQALLAGGVGFAAGRGRAGELATGFLQGRDLLERERAQRVAEQFQEAGLGLERRRVTAAEAEAAAAADIRRLTAERLASSQEFETAALRQRTNEIEIARMERDFDRRQTEDLSAAVGQALSDPKLFTQIMEEGRDIMLTTPSGRQISFFAALQQLGPTAVQLFSSLRPQMVGVPSGGAVVRGNKVVFTNPVPQEPLTFEEQDFTGRVTAIIQLDPNGNIRRIPVPEAAPAPGAPSLGFTLRQTGPGRFEAVPAQPPGTPTIRATPPNLLEQITGFPRGPLQRFFRLPSE